MATKTGKKRAAGEGTIRQRPNGLWEMQVRVRGERVSVYGKTQREAREKGEARKADMRLSDKRKLGEYLLAWLEQKKLEVRPSTWESYERRVKLVLVPALGHFALKDLRASDVRTLMAKLVTDDKSPAEARDTLRNALGQLVEDGVLNRNPAAISMPEYAKREPRPLTADETRKLLEVLSRDTVYGVVMSLILTAGLRLGEALGVRVGDVEEDIVRVRVQLLEFTRKRAEQVKALPKKANDRWLVAWVGELHALSKVKSKAGERDLVVLPAIGTALAALASGRGADELLFTSTKGGPIFHSVLRKAWSKALKAAGIEDAVRVHDARHTTGSAMIEANVDLRTVQGYLGHSDPSLTARTYTKVREASMRRAAEAMGALLKGPEKKG